MIRALRRVAIGWLVLLGLLLAELGVTWLAPGRVGPLLVLALGAAMVGLVGFVFMRLREGGGLAQAFVIAALFWLTVLLGLGTMDPLTRTDYPVPIIHPQ